MRITFYNFPILLIGGIMILKQNFIMGESHNLENRKLVDIIREKQEKGSRGGVSSHCGGSVQIDEFSGAINWKSPNYPRKYPNNYVCEFYSFGTKPECVVVEVVEKFRIANRRCTSDYLTINNIGIEKLDFCGRYPQGYTETLPNHAFHAIFTTDRRRRKRGFHIRLTPRQCPCHESIALAPGETRVITPPSSEEICEYWIEATIREKVFLAVTMTNWQQPDLCDNYVMVDPTDLGGYAMADKYCSPAVPETLSKQSFFKILIVKPDPESSVAITAKAVFPDFQSTSLLSFPF